MKRFERLPVPRWVQACGVTCLMMLSACSSGGSGGSGEVGTLNVSLTDAPACGFDHVYVTVDHIEMSPDGGAWTTVPVRADLSRIDLLSLTNGTLLPLGSTPLAAGTYEQVRLVLKDNGASAPWNNALVLTGSTTELPLKTPSGQQSGYKIRGPITVQANTLADLVLDFDACQSIVAAGASGQHLLKPVVTATAQVVSGAIEGTAQPGSQVSAQQPSASGAVVVKSTVADATTGAFTLSPVLSSAAGGLVDVVVVPPATVSSNLGSMTSIVQSVPITAGASTQLGQLTSVTSPIYAVSGTVTVAGTAGAANLSVTQTLSSSAKTYWVSSALAPAGTYSLPLAASGPRVSTYSISLPQTFTTITAPSDVGIYQIQATDASGTMLTQSVNVSAGNATANFALTP
jgi:hypothetical protein